MILRKQVDINGKDFIIETGKLAKQASGAVWVQLGDTVVLATVVADRTPKADTDFFPLTVEYREKAYAVGKIPGGFFKREGKPSETEILSARLVDRPIRPLFPKDFKNEVQVMVMVLSADRENDADVLGITGASAALCISDIPFECPIAGARVGRIKGEFVINPTYQQRVESDMDLIIAASEDSILMVEGEAGEVSEQDMLAAFEFGHQEIKKLIELQKEMVKECARPKMEFEVPDHSELQTRVTELVGDQMDTILRTKEKEARRDKMTELTESIKEQLAEEYPEMERVIGEMVHDMEKFLMRKMIIEEGVRLDGRGADEIREISIEVGLLPRAHGSALFTRGQTQVLAATTLGTKIDEQRIEGMEGDFWKNYMLHYNFPPYSTGEVKPIRGTSRREIGHGNLAERAIKPVLPSDSIFPYTLRIVADVMESNGSSSMASVCSGALSLMDAGVPIKTPIAGIAMGLIKEEEKVVVLTDILGDEDHMGDMDFKVAGNREGITAFQMDIKIKGISPEIMREALEKARVARLFILDKMEAVIATPRENLSVHAPRILTLKINQDSIGTVIGPGGKMIREITEKTGATINIDDDGTVTIASVDPEAGEMALKIIQSLTAEPEVGTVYDGKVKKIMNFGAFVEILPGREGLLHISEIDNRRVEKVEDVLKVGDSVKVKLIKVTKDGKLDLSRKALLNE
ncbi:polyribonucleotide nucleotidyltransferase [candidate division KSB1 bacterium]|nr:polyribonucleotide nucleotidyltransferase [candidate division KSB1 bacterium]